MPVIVALTTLAAVPIVLTRAEAERLSPRELEQRLLADVPHGEIEGAEVPSFDATSPLSHVTFRESGRAAGGRLCSAHRIVVTFSTVHGGVPRDDADRARDAPRRRFAVRAAPLLAVVEGTATDAACARVTRYAQLPPSDPAGGRRAAEAVLRAAARPGAVRVTCVDEMSRAAPACDGRAALAALDWSRLGSVELPDSNYATTRLGFWWNSNWTVSFAGTDATGPLQLRRAPPPPF